MQPDRKPETSNAVEGRLKVLPARMKWVVSAIWAVTVCLLMAGGAALLDLSTSDMLLTSVLGGLGAAAYILFFASRR